MPSITSQNLEGSRFSEVEFHTLRLGAPAEIKLISRGGKMFVCRISWLLSYITVIPVIKICSPVSKSMSSGHNGITEEKASWAEQSASWELYANSRREKLPLTFWRKYEKFWLGMNFWLFHLKGFSHSFWSQSLALNRQILND